MFVIQYMPEHELILEVTAARPRSNRECLLSYYEQVKLLFIFELVLGDMRESKHRVLEPRSAFKIKIYIFCCS